MRLNILQRLVLAVGLVVFVLAGLYVPWTQTVYERRHEFKQFAGYHWIWLGPGNWRDAFDDIAEAHQNGRLPVSFDETEAELQRRVTTAIQDAALRIILRKEIAKRQQLVLDSVETQAAISEAISEQNVSGAVKAWLDSQLSKQLQPHQTVAARWVVAPNTSVDLGLLIVSLVSVMIVTIAVVLISNS